MRPYTIPILIAAGMSATIAVLAWRRRRMRGARLFSILMLAVAHWTLTYAIELEVPGLAAKVFWVKVQYAGIVVVPVAWLVFCIDYVDGRGWLSGWNTAALAVIPLAVVVLTWTNPYHHLMMREVRLVQTDAGPLLSISRGPAFWLHMAYAYASLLSGTVLLVQAYVRGGLAYRRQSRLLLIAAFIPWAGNLLYVFGGGVLSRLDFTSFLFSVSGAIIFWALFRHRFLDLIPVARNTVIENMQDGLVVIDVENRMADLNPAAERLLGLTGREAIGEPVSDGLAEWPDLVTAYRAVGEGQAEVTVDEDGERRTYSTTFSPIWRDDVRSSGRLITIHEITERKRAEEALRERAAKLQARNEELDAFAHTVAHDLKAPLTSVVGYAEVLQDYDLGPSSDDARELLEEISASGRKMASIIDELLLLSRVRQTEEVERRPLDMEVVVEDALHRVDELRRTHGAVISGPTSWPWALGYRPWVEEVWVNYLSNAIKHGGRPPEITMGATREAHDRIHFWVRDNGPGLTQEEKEQLFAPFTQLGTRDPGGHGLGLSIVRRIVDKLGGRVTLESEVSKGSVFGFVLEAVDPLGSEAFEAGKD